MGKGKGKAGRREAKLAAKKLNQVPKIPGVPKPAQPQKKAKKIPSREKKSTINTNMPGPAAYPIPMGRPKPFTKSPQHAKWPTLFKKHLQLIESQIRALDRIMQSMKLDMVTMPEKERLEYELGERGNWRVICGMMDRTREVLAMARQAARGILPSRALQDKKGLGVTGTNYEPLGPQLQKKAADLGYDPTGKGELGRNSEDVDEDGDTEMSDVSDDTDSEASDSDKEGADSDAAVESNNSDFVQPNIGAKFPRFPNAENSETIESSSNKENKPAGVEPNPYFVVDLEPTPVELNDSVGEKNTRKRRREEEKELRRANKEAKKAAHKATKDAAAADASTLPKEATPPLEPRVDFAALEVKLKAEIAAGTKAQEEAKVAQSAEGNKSKKKRRRSNDGESDEVAEKKAKIDKSEKKKRKAEESVADEDFLEKKSKKEKKEKKEKEEKEKKRKADDSADQEEVEESTKKKRKHKSAS
ncbi:hypothetical protein MBM_06334 [Drepanopeziza brunnea f. sp. 'multigermtubi' MB_m1]|uniref:Uncharacterized protein n=1 Tax=Marssonina brunnea f. sp. multigermtubi (strain MB_m1) TaxID=1072389 RepID=K1WRQ9_MARBU|nr:uncharacterized protein MBM_06334 [Drepanopeziza brunnea f. sp. 'multigermtubi' MB_m1]EKD15706.1 hypothetical protein MBM_06334 [Drepanopeziza brunnea f. sp. 'multigermtubi' MB_m1]